MKRIVVILICLLALTSALAEGARFNCRFADATEGAELLLSNAEYYAGMNQSDLDFRLQKRDGTLDELKAFAAAQTLDFSAEEKSGIEDMLREIEATCDARGYQLPQVDDIVFVKTTMLEECGAGAYTHGTQIYLGEQAAKGFSQEVPRLRDYAREVLPHELFHCLTRNDPDFRAAMYGILGFTVAGKDFELTPSVRAQMISNPDVERHDAFAAFEIDGALRDCVVVFTSGRDFDRPGDSFFTDMVTGLVPIDDLSMMYTARDAANFWDVFGRNTNYVIDPEETLAENFAMTILQGPDGDYETPEIIEAIDACLRSGSWHK